MFGSPDDEEDVVVVCDVEDLLEVDAVVEDVEDVFMEDEVDLDVVDVFEVSDSEVVDVRDVTVVVVLVVDETVVLLVWVELIVVDELDCEVTVPVGFIVCRQTRLFVPLLNLRLPPVVG